MPIIFVNIRIAHMSSVVIILNQSETCRCSESAHVNFITRSHRGTLWWKIQWLEISCVFTVGEASWASLGGRYVAASACRNGFPLISILDNKQIRAVKYAGGWCDIRVDARRKHRPRFVDYLLLNFNYPAYLRRGLITRELMRFPVSYSHLPCHNTRTDPKRKFYYEVTKNKQSQLLWYSRDDRREKRRGGICMGYCNFIGFYYCFSFPI